MWKSKKSRATPVALPVPADYVATITPLSFVPSSIVVSFSGGKDSLASLLAVRNLYFGQCPIIMHYQKVEEDWPGTQGYCEGIALSLGLELVVVQAFYYAYICRQVRCQHGWLSANPKPKCDRCHEETGEVKMIVKNLRDMIRWRKMYPSKKVRYCTSYLKEEVYDRWARRHREKLGATSVLVIGYRWAESLDRQSIEPFIASRKGVETKEFSQMQWHPILHWRRIDCFRSIRSAGLLPHLAYTIQGMTDHDMYETDVEGGPRCSCSCCILASTEQVAFNSRLEITKEVFDELEEIEAETGHTWREGVGIAQLRDGSYKAPKIVRGQSSFDWDC
jgi:3'-phosphoadenosine 5'-phosphosulfate sulfotransferase (PAPS reductase)/FAD synthetase